jgi:tetratricopeptide (TPR) repeat protein
MHINNPKHYRYNKLISKMLRLSSEINSLSSKIRVGYYLQLGELYVLTGRVGIGLENLEKAYRIDPGDLDVLQKLTNINRDINNYSDALKYCKKALRIYPRNDYIKIDLADIYSCMGKINYAKRILENILLEDKNNVEAIVSLGLIYAKNLKKYKTAFHLFNKALRLEPGHHQAEIGLGRVLYELGESKKAKKIFIKIYNKDKKCLPTLLNLAEIYDNEKQYKKAVKMYKLANDINTNSYVVDSLSIVKGKLMYKERKFEDAVNTLLPIINKFKKACDIYSIIGTSYVFLKKYKLAEKTFKMQISQCPNCGIGEWNIGELYSIWNRHLLANKYLEIAKLKIKDPQKTLTINKELSKLKKTPKGERK